MKRVENILYYLALFVMAVLMSCDDKSQICDFQDDNQDLVTLSDMEGTISYNNEEKIWTIHSHESNTIDVERIFYIKNPSADCEREGASVKFSGKIHPLEVATTLPAGTTVFCLHLSVISISN